MEENILDLKMPALRKRCKELGIPTKNTDKKGDLQSYLIEHLKAAPTTAAASEGDVVAVEPTVITELSQIKKIAEEMEKPKKKTIGIPEDIRPALTKLAEGGLMWDIDPSSKSVTFVKQLSVCTTLKQPSKNILQAAREAFGAKTLHQSGVAGREGL